jgi:tetratricopeptide (TPR) repeat protein
MKNPLANILSKLGLTESEQSVVTRAVVISTCVFAALVAGFWAYSFYSATPSGPVELVPPSAEAVISSKEVTDLDVEAHEFAARRYMMAGQPDAALPHLRRIAAVRREGNTAIQAMDNMVRAYLEIGEFQKALDAANRLLAAAQDDTLSASLHVRRAIALYNLKQYEESSEVLRTVVERDPKNAEALCFMGQMEAATETRSPTAERFFRRALEADSNYLETKYQFARYFENNGDYKNARALLQQVLAREPLNVRVHARLGMINYYELKTDQALSSYQTALALNPNDYNTHYNLGELYRTLMNDNENALLEFVAALKINPKHAEANYRAGLICAENDMMKEAVRYFEACLENDRRNVRRLLQLAAAYERVGDKDEALAVYREITDIDPLHSIAIQKIRFLENPQ